MNVLSKVHFLRQKMIENGWSITCFNFSYKQVDFIVLAKLYINEKIPKFAVLKFDFIKSDDLNEHLEIPVNERGLILKTNSEKAAMRSFFNIEWAENIGDIFKQFNTYLIECVPIQLKECLTENEKYAMVKSLSKSDSEDPKKIYCFAVRRNPLNKDKTPQKRSVFNDNKTRLLRPSLYKKLCADKTLSFCYSLDRNEEKTDTEILKNMAGAN
ncbi:MAG: hypothetical protein HFK06_01670 [Clostridia bacterium]|nr:hypothetical protein [Clostridia bacterium]